MAFNAQLLEHLQSGTTTICNAWSILRRDGVLLGFTDHDCDLTFEGNVFLADGGLTISALERESGLSVDNAEAVGALSSSSISEEDIAAGKYDDAEVVGWLVNWQSVDERQIIFRGEIGEITRFGGAFKVELRGLNEILNRPAGRVFQKPCAALLGDESCRVNLTDSSHVVEIVSSLVQGKRLHFKGLAEYPPGWFSRGRLEFLDGPAADMSVGIKVDILREGGREIDLWLPLSVDPGTAPTCRLYAGCDKRFTTCISKFQNAINFQGFPDIPGDDWILVIPSRSDQRNGGSLR